METTQVALNLIISSLSNTINPQLNAEAFREKSFMTACFDKVMPTCLGVRFF